MGANLVAPNDHAPVVDQASESVREGLGEPQGVRLGEQLVAALGRHHHHRRLVGEVHAAGSTVRVPAGRPSDPRGSPPTARPRPFSTVPAALE